MHKHEITLRLHHTDSLRIAYYGSVFELAHECYESFLDIAAILKEGKYVIPIVHAEADYREAMELSDKITIEMALAETGTSSFTLEYRFINQHKKITSEIKTIHSVLDRKTRQPIKIPDSIKKRLSEL